MKPQSYRELREDMSLAAVVQQYRIGPLCKLRVRALVDACLQETVARRDSRHDSEIGDTSAGDEDDSDGHAQAQDTDQDATSSKMATSVSSDDSSLGYPLLLADDSLVELVDQLSCGIPVAVKELVYTMAEENSYGRLQPEPSLRLAPGNSTSLTCVAV